MNATLRNFALWGITVLLLMALFTLFQNPSPAVRSVGVEIPFSQFLIENDSGKVREFTVVGKVISGIFTDGRNFRVHAPNGVNITERPR